MKTKTKKQPKPSRPLGRFVWSTSLSSQDGMPYVMWKRKQSHRHRPHLIIPMTKDDKCQRAAVVEAMAQGFAKEESKSFKRLSPEWQATFRRLASAALTRLGWPETKGGVVSYPYGTGGRIFSSQTTDGIRYEAEFDDKHTAAVRHTMIMPDGTEFTWPSKPTDHNRQIKPASCGLIAKTDH